MRRLSNRDGNLDHELASRIRRISNAVSQDDRSTAFRMIALTEEWGDEIEICASHLVEKYRTLRREILQKYQTKGLL
jgi:hypothetical protein